MAQRKEKQELSSTPPPRPWARAAALLCFSIVVLMGAIARLEPETILVRACTASFIIAVVVRVARGFSTVGLTQGVRRV